jgi:hypothetical protein
MITEKRAHNFDDKTGKRYGDLVVLGLHDIKIVTNGKKKSLWKCVCDCGKELIVISGNLTSGNTTNCGCERIQRLQFYVDTILRLPEGESAFNCILSKYEYGAKRRGLEFELPKEKFRELCIDNCFYCGTNPGNIEPASGYRNGEFIYNGIDRVDNNKGYTIDNCVTCCKICNLMKHALTQEQFLEHVENIVKHLESRKKNVQK